MKKRLRAKLQVVNRRCSLSGTCRSRNRHVVTGGGSGYLNYHAIPGNMAALEAFRTVSVRYWLWALRRRSQRHERKSWAMSFSPRLSNVIA